MNPIEAALAWGAAAGYAAATMIFLYCVVFLTERGLRLAMVLAVLAIVLHTATIFYRVYLAGHVPVFETYENALTGSWAIAVVGIYLARRSRSTAIGLAALPPALFMLGFGLLKYSSASPLPPPYRSSWLVIHVAFAQIAYGAFAMAAMLGVVYLLKVRAENLNKTTGILSKLPSAERLDELLFRLVLFGFVTSALMIVAGAFWADALWGSYWSWDPVETWALISWMIYAVFIHLRLIHGWRGKRLAWLAVAAMAAVVISYWGAEKFSARSHVESMQQQ